MFLNFIYIYLHRSQIEIQIKITINDDTVVYTIEY